DRSRILLRPRSSARSIELDVVASVRCRHRPARTLTSPATDGPALWIQLRSTYSAPAAGREGPPRSDEAQTAEDAHGTRRRRIRPALARRDPRRLAVAGRRGPPHRVPVARSGRRR